MKTFKCIGNNTPFTFILLTLLTFTLSLSTLWAQSPEKMSYQAIIRNADDSLVADITIGMQVSILQGSASGTAVYVETQTPSTNVNGLVSIEIGAGAVVSGDFTAIDWANGPYFLKTETDPASGTNYTITGTSQLLSVPYALHAKTAENITNLADPVNSQDAATKAYVDLLIERIGTLEVVAGIKIEDYDGNIYSFVEIGSQVWMAENLKTTHYADGTAIPLVEGTSGWDALVETDKAYCYYDNSTTNRDVYGALYTWAAAMNGAISSNANPSGVQGVCPDGWHLPSDAEWTVLTDYLGGEAVAGGEMKETDTTHWSTPNTGATNSSGFTALPGGYRDSFGYFGRVGLNATFWSSMENDSDNAMRRELSYSTSIADRNRGYKVEGFSVRCLRD